MQGVGFRPWVYRLARDAGLAGTVRNDPSGVTIEAFGADAVLDAFLGRLEAEPPPAAAIQRLSWEPIAGPGPAAFTIAASTAAAERTVSIPPDLATCRDCLAEVAGPADRRHRYPFTNCTNCGPRFTIVLDVPYDRPATTMARFRLCPDCRREYEDPGDRRFHAQPNACPVCGPRLALEDGAGATLAERDEALRQAARTLAAGRILALKGLGGFLLLVDARDGPAVARLRRRKARWEKPLALMVADLAAAERLCEVPAAAAELLVSAASPIVLLKRRSDTGVADGVAPGNPYLGVMLPYTPLHHLLLREVGFPLVATSGNLSDEPIAIDNREARARLGAIADLFLMHDRPIARHADDSVAFVLAGEPRLLRRARGYAPAPIRLARRLARRPPPLLAVGGHLKNTVAVSLGGEVFLSQHIGDMETPQALGAFERVVDDLLRMLEVEPVAIAHDLHPDYLTTRWAAAAGGSETAGFGFQAPRRLAGLPLVPVQHHHAHLASCLAEHGETEPALGVTWDGTGYGTDGTVWGGEFLLGDARSFRRVARLRPFRLPGGEAAVREPRRSALALLWELEGEGAFERQDLAPVAALRPEERRVLARMLATGLNTPLTTSAGRLFDAVGALLDLRQRVAFEGQAAMAVEFAADPAVEDAYPLGLREQPVEVAPESRAGEEPPPHGRILELDWGPLVVALLADLAAGVAVPRMAARFHNGLTEGIVRVAQRIGAPRVALTGGCFQNRLLTERTAERLQEAGFSVLLHRQVPPNDGGVSLGQVAVAAVRLGADGFLWNGGPRSLAGVGQPGGPSSDTASDAASDTGGAPVVGGRK